jgi:hypothetical protein
VAAPVFTERFLIATAPGFTNYTVPNGKRAIVKTFTGYNGGASAALGSIAIGGQTIWVASIPGGSGSVIQNCTIVVNGNELLGLYCGGTSLALSAHGYLLSMV